MEVDGTLLRYGPAGPQVALVSGPSSATRALILVGGLTDGLLFAPYVVPLTAAVTAMGWLVAHASLQSAWQGYGTGSLDRDAADLRALAAALRARRRVSGVVLCGHSTGCQDAVRYCQLYGPHGAAAAAAAAAAQPGGQGQGEEERGALREGGGEGGGDPYGGAGAPAELLGTILQAPVSDPEWLSGHTAELGAMVAAARAAVAAGRGEEVVGRLELADGAPVCARRLLSLYDLGGDDSMFCEGLALEVVQRLLAPLSARPCLLLASGADECVPDAARIPERAAALAAAAAAACGGAAAVAVRVVPGAPHNLAGHEGEAVEAMCEFLRALPGGAD